MLTRIPALSRRTASSRPAHSETPSQVNDNDIWNFANWMLRHFKIIATLVTFLILNCKGTALGSVLLTLGMDLCTSLQTIPASLPCSLNAGGRGWRGCNKGKREPSENWGDGSVTKVPVMPI